MGSRTQFSFGDVVRTSARLCAGKAGVFLGLSLIGVVPAYLTTMLTTMLIVLLGDELLVGALALVLLQGAVGALCFGWAQASITYYAVRTLRTESPTIGETAGQALRKAPHVGVAFFLAGLAIALGLFLLVVPGIVLWLMFWVVAPVAAVEGGTASALRRSHALTNGHKWPLLGVVALFLLLLLVFVLAVAGAVALVAPPSLAVQLAWPVVAQTVIWAVWGVVSAASYYHLRSAAEGGSAA